MATRQISKRDPCEIWDPELVNIITTAEDSVDDRSLVNECECRTRITTTGEKGS